MKNVRVDGDGEFRCWNCGSKGLLAKRTFRSKVLVGVGTMLTKKKLKCQTCGEYNDTGNAQPFDGPASRKWRKRYEKEQAAKSQATLQAEASAAQAMVAAIAAEVAAASGPAQAALPSSPPPPPPPPPGGVPESLPPSWQPDPHSRHELRYWDGSEFTEHVSNAGVPSRDPLR
jgi:DNA-directed RNA polymerase subunit RPC12/RpoP